MLIVALVQDPNSSQVTTCSVAGRQSSRDEPKNRRAMIDEYVSFICSRQNLHRSEIVQLMVIRRDKIVHFFSEEDLA